MDTDRIIARLAQDAPARRLPAPAARAALWISVALISVVAVVYAMSLRPDLAMKMSDVRFVIEQVSALLTAATAAVAAFATTIPGRSRSWIALPALPLAVWLSCVGYGCVAEWLSGSAGFQSDWLCLPAIAAVGAIPAVAMVAMLRAGAPLLPRTSVALGGLAAGALGDFGLRLFHTADGGWMVLVWQLGSVAILTWIAGRAGPSLLRWRHLHQPR
jgi:hypothetical protein